MEREGSDQREGIMLVGDVQTIYGPTGAQGGRGQGLGAGVIRRDGSSTLMSLADHHAFAAPR